MNHKTQLQKFPTTNNVMIADDDDFFRIAMSSILRHNFNINNITETTTFAEAREALESDLALSAAFFDLSMPGINNVGQLRHLRSDFPNIKIAVVSGSMSKKLIIDALECGLHGYVWKMSGSLEVSRAIEVILGGDIYVPSALADMPPDSAPSPASTALSYTLTPRQIDVLNLLTGGASNREIAIRLGLGEGTIKIHVSGLLRALKVGRRSEAAEVGKVLLGRGVL